MTLTEYKCLFSIMSVNKRGAYRAPHKPVLLLTVIDLIEMSVITTPLVEPSDVLESQFKKNWGKYVADELPFNCQMNYPFYHLASSPFWKMVKSPDYEERKEYSMGALRKCFVGALLDEDLFELLQTERGRQELRAVLEGYLR